ncbi:MAG: M14 family zinc carboxypeptidase [Pseudomonadota bacterium]
MDDVAHDARAFAPELPELRELEAIVAAGGAHLDTRLVCETTARKQRFPVYAVCLGNSSPRVPAVGVFGGVHGLERIGTAVVLAYLRSLVARLSWDSVLHRQLDGLRMVFIPVVNPGGMWLGTRANPNGVDLMRNAPLDAADPVPFLIGGQRIGPRLPWYRGPAGGPMEAEASALCRVVEEELLSREFSIAVDCHSGFGLRDRLWFPYAHTRMPIAHLPEVQALKEILDRTHVSHSYLVEPQSCRYLTHGDLWDYLYQRAASQGDRVFLPFTLEMGSWLWVKKNPRQLFSREGIFNPVVAHRQQRVQRRHLVLLDFLARAACGHSHWRPCGEGRQGHRQRALDRWYWAGNR